jgi:formyltetrahydrofolate hydrolase
VSTWILDLDEGGVTMQSVVMVVHVGASERVEAMGERCSSLFLARES